MNTRAHWISCSPRGFIRELHPKATEAKRISRPKRPVSVPIAIAKRDQSGTFVGEKNKGTTNTTTSPNVELIHPSSPIASYRQPLPGDEPSFRNNTLKITPTRR